MPYRGRTGGPGRPAPWPRPPAADAAAPPASCNANVHQRRSAPNEPPQSHAAGRRPWLCLPRHPGPAPAPPPPSPPRPPAPDRRPTAAQPCSEDELLVSGSRLRPARQAPPRRSRPPRGQGRHHQPSPDPGLVEQPPPGQHRPRYRLPLRRPRRRQPCRRTSHPPAGRRPWAGEFGAAGPHRWRRLAFLSGPHRPGQRQPGRAGACGLAGP